jgi:elongation factor P
MNNETYNQIFLQEEIIDRPEFLKDGLDVEILFHAAEERPLTLSLPDKIDFEVTYTEPGVAGNTATNATKPATLETGAEVRVPLFINQGDKVRIDSKTGSYLERVKS